MTTSAQHDAEDGRWTDVRIGRLQVPGGLSATKQIRRTARGVLRRWGLGPAAGELTDQLTALVQEFIARPAVRGRGPIQLRLELRASARLLLGEIHHLSPSPAGRGVVALTYGRRSRDGIRYIHSFMWWQPDATPTDR
ncbi:hypothetical protein ACN3XK_02625 [Actinomadura welshii]